MRWTPTFCKWIIDKQRPTNRFFGWHVTPIATVFAVGGIVAHGHEVVRRHGHGLTDAERHLVAVAHIVFNATGVFVEGGGTGDRGFGHAPGGNAQDLSSLLGKVLRIDVDVPDAPYAIPADNPLVGPGHLGRPEVWAWGFHDPRGLAVDHDRVLVADRGQDRQEEVTAVTAGTNAGWPVREGTLCFDADDPTRPPTTCRDVGPLGEPLVEPVIALPHPGTGTDGVTVASTIVGGVIVQGVALPGFAGDLVLGDRALVPSEPTGRLLAAGVRRPGDGLLWDPRPVDVAARPDDLGAWLLGIGVDGAGTPCVLTAEEPGPTGTTGAAWRVVPAGGADSF